MSNPTLIEYMKKDSPLALVHMLHHHLVGRSPEADLAKKWATMLQAVRPDGAIRFSFNLDVSVIVRFEGTEPAGYVLSSPAWQDHAILSTVESKYPC